MTGISRFRRGCEGVYGVATGVWYLQGDRLILHADIETTDSMTPGFRHLEVFRRNGEVFLVPSVAKPEFLKKGPSRGSCFTKQLVGAQPADR